MNLKSKILEANYQYRKGTPIMSDLEYDNLLDELQKIISESEFSVFKDSLNESIIENTEKIKHKFICGSLDKLKYQEPKMILKFLDKLKSKKISISAKLDGLSGIAVYKNGKLISFSSRGDGYKGVSFFNKAKYIKGLKQEIDFNDEIWIRGELIIKKNDFIDLSEIKKFANPRNAAAGLMGQKDFSEELISKISFIPYTILGDAYTKIEQFELLEKFGFEVAWNVIEEFDKKTIVEKLFNYSIQDFGLECDGLVVSAADYINENKYRPDNQIAFKCNLQTAKTQVIDIDWISISKDGFICPVAILAPVKLGGVYVSRATLHNLDFIENMNLDFGDTVEIVRSGDVIPRILKINRKNSNYVFENTDNIKYYSKRWGAPIECPCCGTKLIRDGINLRCINSECKEQVLQKLTYFIKNLGIMYASKATLEKFKLYSIEDILNFKPNPKYKNEIKLYDEINEKLFSKSKLQLLAAMNIKDVGEKLITKIVDFYGFDNILNNNYIGLPNGIGEITLNKFKECVLDNLNAVNKIVSDKRYIYLKSFHDKPEKTYIGSVCFTGKLYSITRTDACKKAEAAGYEIYSSVKKGLTYLVTNDSNTNSNKGKKARELNVKIINEEEFLKLISNSVDNVLDSL